MSFIAGFDKVALDPKTVQKLVASGSKKRIEKNMGLIDKITGKKKKYFAAAEGNAKLIGDTYGTARGIRAQLRGPLHPAMRSTGQDLQKIHELSGHAYVGALKTALPKKK